MGPLKLESAYRDEFAVYIERVHLYYFNCKMSLKNWK